MTEAILPTVFLRFVFGLRKTLNHCSAEQETVGATLRMNKNFHKITAGSFPEKKWGERILLWDTFLSK